MGKALRQLKIPMERSLQVRHIGLSKACVLPSFLLHEWSLRMAREEDDELPQGTNAILVTHSPNPSRAFSKRTSGLAGDEACVHISFSYWFYAALPAAWVSRVFSPPTPTLICVGLAAALLARLILGTPLPQWPLTCPGPRLGSVIERVNLPHCRSTRRKFYSSSPSIASASSKEGRERPS
jgi:hypothetical protein